LYRCRAVLCACLLAFGLAACAGGPLREDVIAQAVQDGQIAFDIVKIDDAVLTALLDRPQLPLHQRFKKYVPPPELKIAVGDTVSVIIWESSAHGLFGESLTELSLEPGAVNRLSTAIGETPPTGAASRLFDSAVVSPDLLGLLGGAAAPGAASVAAGLAVTADPRGGATTRQEQLGLPAALPTDRAPRRPLADGGLSRQAEQFLEGAEQTGRPGTRIPDQQVGPDGAISIPYAGRIKVANRTPAEIERRIERLLAPKALDPQALVVVKDSVANSVSVAGDAVDGARVPLSPGGDRLLQVIAAAGGAKAPVHDALVRLSRRGVTATVALATLVNDPEQNIFAEPGDVLTLLRRPQTYSVFGATGQNAAITFTSERLSLSEALAKAGGLLDDRADPRAVFLFRHEPSDVVRALGQPIAASAPDGRSPVVYRLDLQEAKSYLLARRFPVQDKDVIFVANAQTVPIYQFFQLLSQITGPVQTILITCHYTKAC
jgi:polysaccharide biosynthesis/export protein